MSALSPSCWMSITQSHVRTIVGAAAVTGLVAGTGVLASKVMGGHGSNSDVDTPDGFVQAEGNRFTIDGKTFRPFGFNHTSNGSIGTGKYFANPTAENLAEVRKDFALAKKLGGNSLRIFLQLHDFVQRQPDGSITVRPEALEAYSNVLQEAERAGLKLDVTGNLVWKPDSAPAWYDQMSSADRWSVQAKFWKEVANVGKDSPAILCYELTSEPYVAVKADTPWYGGRFGDLNFVQAVDRGVSGAAAVDAMRGWVSTLKGAIREVDQNHLVSVGLMPFAKGPASPEGIGDLVDFMILHDYPEGSGGDPKLIEKNLKTAEAFAAVGKPVLLGETAALSSDVPTQELYLRSTKDLFAGTMTFFTGVDPTTLDPKTIPEAMYKLNLESYLGMKDELG